MKSLILSLLLLATASAAPIINVVSPNIQAAPGQTGTWNVVVSPDSTNFVTFVTSFVFSESNPAMGTYSDTLGFLGGPINFFLPPGGPAWMAELGSYSLSPAVVIGASNNLTVRVLWEEYSDEPMNCGSCFVSSGFSDHTLSITSSDVPEPGSMSLLLLAAAAFASVRLIRPKG